MSGPERTSGDTRTDRRRRPQAVRFSRTLRAGLMHHQAGRLGRAEALYRKIFLADPEHADALHLLGVLAFQCGRMTAALQLIERALPALATLPEIHLNTAMFSQRRRRRSGPRYRRAITLVPDHGMAHNNLARALIEMGAPGEALGSAGRAAELIPDFAGAHANHAGAFRGLGGLPRRKRRCVAPWRLRRMRPDCTLIWGAHCISRNGSMKRSWRTGVSWRCGRIFGKPITISVAS